ncbi:MAG TPA: SURF1 family protein [Rhizomicrobium sp.]|nr:SURF1 family protein [Rhizomicrobium sp.]
MIRFRPLLVPTMWFLPAFLVLMGLGAWQIERLHWKLGLIAEMRAHMSAAPITPEQAIRLGPAAQYRKVVLHGRFENAKEAYLFTTGPEGAPVYHVLTPFRLDGGGVLMADRGYIPMNLKDPALRTAPQGERTFFGVWRTPDPPGAFAPVPDRAHRIWFARDLKGLAKADAVTLAAPVLVEADAAANPGGWPRGGQTIVNLPNNHLSYAVTWFGLACGFLGVYIAFHVSNGRLSWDRKG